MTVCPRIWKDLFKEYQEGKTTKSIHYLTLDNCMESQLKDIKSEYGRIKNNSKLHEIYKKT